MTKRVPDGGIRGGSKRDHRRQSAPVGDPAGGDHRGGRHGVPHRRNERQRSHAAPDVAARLAALGNSDVEARVHGRVVSSQHVRPWAAATAPAMNLIVGGR